MRFNRFSISLALVACLAFVGQAFAAVAFVDARCSGMGNHAPATVTSMATDTAMMAAHQGHAGHHHGPALAKPDCCQQQHCWMADCLSLNSASAAMVTSATPLPVVGVTTLAADYAATYLAADASGLFRPPISR